MLNIKNKSKSIIVALALLAAILIAPLSVLRVSAAEASSASFDIDKSYYSDDYEHLADKDVVFQNITYEEAVYLFQQKGNYLIFLGGPWCGNTNAVIDYINDAAKAAGVTTVYNLDLVLDGNAGYNNLGKEIAPNKNAHIRESNSSSLDGADYNYLYAELVTRYLTNLNDWVEYTKDSSSALIYTDADIAVPKVQVPFLFIYNKDNTVNYKGESVEGKTYPIVYGYEKMLNRDEEGLYTTSRVYNTETEKYDRVTTRVDDATYIQELNDAIFSHIGTGEGKLTLSSFTSADYIRLAYNERAGKKIFEDGQQINIETITYKQLDWLLQQDGTYLILFGGAWCGNTQAVIDIINDYAVANNVTVYNFDTKLDGGYAKYKWGYSQEVHIRDNNNPFSYLYVSLVNTYLPYIKTEYDITKEGQYIFYKDQNDAEVKANKLQVPYFFTYDKSNVDKDGHNAPIVSYVEKMYTLKSERDDYIGLEANYIDYTTAAFDVVSAYGSKVGATVKNIEQPNDLIKAQDDGQNEGQNNENNSSNTGKIVAAVIGVIVVIAIVAAVIVIGKKKSSDNGDKSDNQNL
ncbi:MAG: hypothetical protein IJZ93_01610 [Clostridia bacterium]|nr:hypothetical protein [Clostridia bacterium]